MAARANAGQAGPASSAALCPEQVYRHIASFLDASGVAGYHLPSSVQLGHLAFSESGIRAGAL